MAWVVQAAPKSRLASAAEQTMRGAHLGQWCEQRGVCGGCNSEVLGCPSDPIADPMSLNYAMCIGNLPQIMGPHIEPARILFPNSRMMDHLGTYQAKRAVLLSEFQVGLSQTILFSEIMVGSSKDDLYGLGRPYNNVMRWSGWEMRDPAALNYFASQCANIGRDHQEWILNAGRRWYSNELPSYNHILPPHGVIPDCGFGGWYFYGARTARSYHRGGVGAVWGDGHVTFESNSISIDVWRSHATRAGSEVDTQN